MITEAPDPLSVFIPHERKCKNPMKAPTSSCFLVFINSKVHLDLICNILLGAAAAQEGHTGLTGFIISR